MVSTRPGIKFTEEGICYPCISFEARSEIDWERRWKKLEDLCEFYRAHNANYYDCIICVSSGKDSYYLVFLFKELLKMNPLCLMVDNLNWTQTGRDNFNNLSDVFGVDVLTFTPNRAKLKEQMLKDFLEELHPNKYWDEILYSKPFEFAHKLGIKLLIWGENPDVECGGKNYKETRYAYCLDKSVICGDIESIFTSYYVPWSRYKNVKIAKEYGFKDLIDTMEWEREGFTDMFQSEQIDTVSYLTNNFLKFIKFGFSTLTELCSDAIRHNKMTREEGINAINEHDWKLDKKMLKSFVKELGISKELFFETIDRFVNKDLLVKWHGEWRLRINAI